VREKAGLESGNRFTGWSFPARFEPPGAEIALIVLSVLILVLPAFTPDGPEARVVSVVREVKPLVIEVEKAAWYDWALLEGIGEVRARRIVDFVNRNRPLKNLDQLNEVPGLPRGWLDKAKPFIELRAEVSGP